MQQWPWPSLLVVIWHVLSTGERYQDLGNDWFERRQGPAREMRRLVHRLQALRHTVELVKPPV